MPIAADMNKIAFIVFFGISLSIVGGCGKKEAPQAKAPPANMTPPPAKVEEEPEEEPEKPVYVYSGDRFRDPFTEVGQTTVYQPDAIFNPQQAKVVAIVYSPRIRSAAIKISGTGSYYVTGNRIFDIMGKTVKGYKAQVFVDKVVVKGEADEVFELKIRETEKVEEEKSL